VRRASLSRLIDLAAQLAQDAEQAPDLLRRRDRGLGRELAEASRGGIAGITAWLDRVRPAGADSPGDRVERAARALVAGLVVVGLAVGAGAAGALFTYDGRHPVNAVRVLALFVGVQLALLASTCVLCLPAGWRRRVPGLAALQDLLGLASPARLAAGLRRLLPGAGREEAARLVSLARRHQRLYADVQKWWMLSASQGFGVAFNLAAIATALALVAFTDLAFGWSTTLDVDAATLLRITSLLSLPWSSVWGAAVPTPELIAGSQYFRAAAHHDPGAGAAWWRFLLACMACYGLAPRLAMLAFARWRLRAALASAFRRVPGVAALRDRLESRLVETTAERAEQGAGPAAATGAADAPAPPPGTRCHALVWAGFPLADAQAAARELGVEVMSLAQAGLASLEADAAALRALAATPAEEPVLVITRAWEPPVKELVDFLEDLRDALGEARAVLVVPLAVDGQRPAAPAASDAAMWRRAVERLGDPATALLAPAGAA
jgi:hypothetical protein